MKKFCLSILILLVAGCVGMVGITGVIELFFRERILSWVKILVIVAFLIYWIGFILLFKIKKIIDFKVVRVLYIPAPFIASIIIPIIFLFALLTRHEVVCGKKFVGGEEQYRDVAAINLFWEKDFWFSNDKERCKKIGY